MTPNQQRIIRSSFDELRGQAIPVAMLFYGRLFALDPAIKPLFHVDIREQSRKLMEMLGSVVEGLDDFESMKPALRQLGRKHLDYGVKDAHYDTLAAALMWTLGQALEGGFNAEARDAWSLAIGAICAEMKSGAA